MWPSNSEGAEPSLFTAVLREVCGSRHTSAATLWRCVGTWCLWSLFWPAAKSTDPHATTQNLPGLLKKVSLVPFLLSRTVLPPFLHVGGRGCVPPEHLSSEFLS